MRIHKTHVKAGEWSHEIPDSEMEIAVHDGVTYGIMDKHYYLDTKTSRVRWTRETAQAEREQRELFVVVGKEAFALTHMYGDETLQDRLSLSYVGGAKVHESVKLQFSSLGSPLAKKLAALGQELPFPEGKTKRGYEGSDHLFPAREFGQYSISVQGSSGHHSTPKADLDFLEDYEKVEVIVYGPGGVNGSMLHPSEIGLRGDLFESFGNPPKTESDVPVGVNVPWEAVWEIQMRLRELTAWAGPSLKEDEGAGALTP